MTEPRIVGVRHHSPACARLVRRVIESVSPTHVLIEGPSDFNPSIQQLQLQHRPPVALFSSLGGARRAYSPFCDYSPEWVALRSAAALGAEVRFIDLPAWHEAMSDVPNRYHDRPLLDEEAVARRLGYDCTDALWDATVEQAPESELEQRLAEFFSLIRCRVSEQDQQREKFMARWVAWAQAQGPTVVVCGGFHAPYLRDAWREVEPQWPELPHPEGALTCLVPFSFSRLDSFRGYAAGMPSPEFYQQVWEQGWDEAARHCLLEAARQLRSRGQVVSSADLIAAWANARTLQRLRGHRYVLRADVLDGIVGALVKHPLDSPLPWSYRGSLQPHSDPLLVALMAAFSGDRRGELDPATPRPPLVADVLQQLKAHDLVPVHPARHQTVQPGSPESHILHRLDMLRVSGFHCEQTEPAEEWILSETPEFHASLIEAAAYGATLEAAATAFLESQVQPESGAALVSRLVALASQAGLLDLTAMWLSRLGPALGRETRLDELTPALRNLNLALRLSPQLRGTGRELLAVGIERALWLLQTLPGEEPAALSGVLALRDLLLGSDIPTEPVLSVMERLATSVQLDLRGGALGFLWSVTGKAPPLAAAIRGIFPPERVGDFLRGLFTLAREQVAGNEELLAELHSVVSAMDGALFLRALPALREAFEHFPPREKQRIALNLLPWLGLQHPSQLLRSTLEPAEAVLAARLDAAVEEEVRRYGW